jgi:hypothetical protein
MDTIIKPSRIAAGRLEEVFVDGVGQVWRIAQRSPGGAWGDWARLGAEAQATVITRNQKGSLEVSVLSFDGHKQRDDVLTLSMKSWKKP